jgi:hypothetical protein
MQDPRKGELHEVVNKQQDIQDNAFPISRHMGYRKEFPRCHPPSESNPGKTSADIIKLAI